MRIIVTEVGLPGSFLFAALLPRCRYFGQITQKRTSRNLTGGGKLEKPWARENFIQRSSFRCVCS
jgi:hypothetical protein